MGTHFLLIDDAGHKLKIDDDNFLLIDDTPLSPICLISGDVEFLKSIEGDVEFTTHIAEGIIA
jgi:hypothetical protein